ncbi:MAG: hypothetical protein KDC92_02980, partial [Bacteroidetes bacterium]|nr:hypothetical protein [Bacteroidota bacterium]
DMYFILLVIHYFGTRGIYGKIEWIFYGLFIVAELKYKKYRKSSLLQDHLPEIDTSEKQTNLIPA